MLVLRRSASVAWRVDLIASVGPRAALSYRLISSRHRGLGAAPFTELHDGIWRDAAAELGADVIPGGNGIFELRRGDAVTQVSQHVTELDDPATLRVALDRLLVHRLLTEAGVPVPEHETFGLGSMGDAVAFLERHGGPAVVKPASGTGGGRGITCSIKTRADLFRATLAALPFDDGFVVERQVRGEMYRLLFLDGELLSIVRRDPPCVIGDGRSNVAELILAENRRRLAAGGKNALSLIRPDLDFVFALRSAGMNPRSVPLAHERVRVKTATSENGPDENVTVRGGPSAAVARDALAAVRATGLRFAGVDLVTLDLQRDLRDVGGAIVEVNGTPGLRYHYAVSDPDRADRVAVPVLKRLLDDALERGGAATP
jgi:cyanophycin synthetase